MAMTRNPRPLPMATGINAWAALSISGLKAIRLTSEVRAVIAAADGDAAGSRDAEVVRDWPRIATAREGLDFGDLLDS